MILRVIRALMGQSHRDAQAETRTERRNAEYTTAMRAVQMKVSALKAGADRMDEERKKTEDAARVMLAKLREDFPK